MSELNVKSMEAFIDGFYGYGNLKAPYWFIGMEEGGGKNLQEVHQRIKIWQERGEKFTENLVDYHKAIHVATNDEGVIRFFGTKPKLQRTWSNLIRVLHVLEGLPNDNDALRQTQATNFGRGNGNSCLLELLPLPSPSVGNWLYTDYFNDRDTYREKILPKRIKRIKDSIKEYKPQTVLFYGMSYREHWQDICEQSLESVAIANFNLLFAQHEQTFFVVTHHPASKGITKDYFNKIGEWMRKRI